MPVVFGLGACLGLEKTESRFKWFTRFTQIYADNLRAAEVCSAEATELPFWERPPVSVANGLCHPTRDDTVYSLVELVSGEPFHLKNTFPQKYRNFLHNPSYRPPLLLLDLMPSSLGHPYKL